MDFVYFIGNSREKDLPNNFKFHFNSFEHFYDYEIHKCNVKDLYIIMSIFNVPLNIIQKNTFWTIALFITSLCFHE